MMTIAISRELVLETTSADPVLEARVMALMDGARDRAEKEWLAILCPGGIPFPTSFPPAPPRKWDALTS